MKLGIIGRGHWGNVYAKTLEGMGIAFTQAGRNWRYEMDDCDGVIVACAAEAHYEIAAELIDEQIPVLIEKPLCLDLAQAKRLLKLANDKNGCAPVFTGHTRLYSTAWRAFKERALKQGVKSVYAAAGGQCRLDPLWDWGPHLVAMCIDLGFDPPAAHIIVDKDRWPLKLGVNGTMMYADVEESPRPLEVLLTEFMDAIKAGNSDISGLELGVKVVAALEAMELQREDMRIWRSA
jgi:Oxidoreductase family, NAD-binding Rossmann fold